MKRSHKTLLVWVLLSLTFLGAYNLLSKQSPTDENIPFSELIHQMEHEPSSIKQVTIQARSSSAADFTVDYQEGTRVHTVGIITEQTMKLLHGSGIAYDVQKEGESSLWQAVLISWLPMLLLGGLFFFFMRRLQAGGGKLMGFGKSKAKLQADQQNPVTFANVAGIEEAKDEVEEIITFLKDPKKFTRLGGRIPKGVLLLGPPGTGKTLLARAIAGEAAVPFFSTSGSDFVEMFVGVGASRMRDLFEQGQKHAPCIIFIDEIDAVGRHRGAGLGGGHDEREQTLNQLLVEMDGFQSNDGVILVAATNRPDVLDPALLRPGRFDRRIVVPHPDVNGRLGILRVHSQKVPLGPDVDLDVLARGTPGFSGADLENLVNEAALLAAREDKDHVESEDLERSKDRELMGSERRSMIISAKDKRTIAYHEAGHALVAKLLPGTDPVHKVTITPRGRTLGLTQQLPTEDRHNMSCKFAEKQISIMMGGRVAEELVFDQVTSGAANDIVTATDLARKMVTKWGMSEKLGPVALGKKEETIFLGREFSQHQELSQETAKAIDAEMRRIVSTNHDRTREIITKNLDKLKLIAEALIEHETLDAEALDQLMTGIPLAPRVVPDAAPNAGLSGCEDREKRPLFVPSPEPAKA